MFGRENAARHLRRLEPIVGHPLERFPDSPLAFHIKVGFVLGHDFEAHWVPMLGMDRQAIEHARNGPV